MSLGGVPVGRIALAIAFGLAGGALFAWARLPLPWMLGSMVVVTLAALAGVPVGLPSGLRGAMVTVIGVLLGSAFTPELMRRAATWAVTLGALVLYIAIGIACALWYLRRYSRYDAITAFFSAAPGGLNEMVVVGRAMGGDDRVISLTHAARVFLVVMILPFWFRFFEGYVPPPVVQQAHGLMSVPPLDLLILAACGLVGALVARRLRLPAAMMMGPMILSATVHLAGITDQPPPWELVAVGQIAMGTAVGCRFAGVRAASLLDTLRAAAGTTVILVGITVVFAMVLHRITGISMQGIVLAFTPGGLAEMSLVALALGIDTAFVSTHHVARIAIIVVMAPLFYRLIGRRWWDNPDDGGAGMDRVDAKGSGDADKSKEGP